MRISPDVRGSWLLVWSLLLTLLISIPCSAQKIRVADPKINLSLTLTLADGTVYANAPVNIKNADGKMVMQCFTDGTGKINQRLAPGTYTIGVGMVERQLEIKNGEVTELAFAVKPTGILFSITSEVEGGFQGQVYASVKLPKGPMMLNQVSTLGPGKYLYQDVPKDAEAFAVMVVSYADRMGVWRKEWTIENPGEAQQFTVNFAKPKPQRVLVVDAKGQPVVNAQVRGALSTYQVEYRYYDAMAKELWAPPGQMGGGQNLRRVSMDLGVVQSDAQGQVALGTLAPGQYELILRANGEAGAPQPLEIKPDGASSLEKYTLAWTPRQVSQTIFDAAGKAVPGAQVTGSYAWAGKWVLRTGTADAAGIVLWKDLPPVRMIVWGTGVPAGVVPADAAQVTKPLPAPVSDGSTSIRLVPDIPFDPKSPVQWLGGSSQYLGGGYPYPPNITMPTLDAVGYGVNHLQVERGYAEKQAQLRWSVVSSDRDANYILPAPMPMPVPMPITPGIIRQPVEEVPAGTYQQWMQNGLQTSLVGVIKSTPPKLLFVDNAYIPYADGEPTAELVVKSQDGATVQGQFVLKTTGKALGGVSRFQVLPQQVPALPSGITLDQLRSLGLLVPQERPDGTFSIALPGAGTYRLLVDLFDERAPSQPELMLAVKHGVATGIKVAMPAPLFTAPAGAALSWLSLNAPADTRRLTVAAREAAMPVFGPREALLAAWYRDTPEKLVLWTFTNKAQPRQEITWRAGMLTLLDKDGNPLPSLSEQVYYGKEAYLLQNERGEILRKTIEPNGYLGVAYRQMQNMRLPPFLPVPVNERWNQTPISLDRLPADAFNTPLAGDQPNALDVWVGKYLFATGQNPSGLTLVDFGAGTTDVTLRLDPSTVAVQQSGRQVRLRFTEGNYDEQRKTAAQFISVNFDVPNTTNTQLSPWNVQPKSEMSLNVPLDAKTISLSWLGVGKTPPVALPEFVPGAAPVVELPAFEGGATVTGVIRDVDGSPMKSGQLWVTTADAVNNSVTNLAIDEQGRFTLRGVPDGPLFIFQNQQQYYNRYDMDRLMREGEQLQVMEAQLAQRAGDALAARAYRPAYQAAGAGWVVNVTEGGAQDVTLHATATPIQFNIGYLGNAAAVWWFPEKGTPTRLPYMNNMCGSMDLKPGAGALWVIGAQQMQYYTRTTLTAGMNNITFTPGPTVGLLFPLDLQAGLPGAVTLIGKGERAGVSATITDLFWQPSPALNMVVGQINAVPPGTYEVQVQTARGVVKGSVTVTDDGGSLSLAYPAK